MIHYKKGYKYQLVKDKAFVTNVYPVENIVTDWIWLGVDGILLVKKGYAWDGPSGPTIDTPSFMQGALVHDALYQLGREGLLSEVWRKVADRELVRFCKMDGMGWFRRQYVYAAVRWFAGKHYCGDGGREILTAP